MKKQINFLSIITGFLLSRSGFGSSEALDPMINKRYRISIKSLKNLQVFLLTKNLTL